MKKSIKKKWLAALRSGEYVQGKGQLLNIDENGEHSFCCLGVLCDLHSQETNTKWYGEAFSPYVLYEGSVEDLPEVVNGWSGVPIDIEGTLASMNDGGKSFKAIANYIEKEL